MSLQRLDAAIHLQPTSSTSRTSCLTSEPQNTSRHCLFGLLSARGQHVQATPYVDSNERSRHWSGTRHMAPPPALAAVPPIERILPKIFQYHTSFAPSRPTLRSSDCRRLNSWAGIRETCLLTNYEIADSSVCRLVKAFTALQCGGKQK